MNPFTRRAINTSDPKEKLDPYGDWALLGGKQARGEDPLHVDEELLRVAREAWPRVLAHARRELADKGLGADKTAVAAEVWEGVLRAVSRALQRRSGEHTTIGDLQSYLIAAFHHRFNRVLKREQRRIETIALVSSTLDLEGVEGTQDTGWVSELERAITIRQITVHMDEWTRRVWRARQYGYSWEEIAERLGVSERHARRKFREGLEKTRERLVVVLRKRKSQTPGEQ